MLGKKIKSYRKSQGLTQKEFADQLGIARSTLGDYETGRIKGSKDFLTKLCDVTNTPISVWVSRETSDGIELRDMEGLYIMINSLISSGEATLDNPIPKQYKNTLTKMLELEIKTIIKNRSL